MARRGLLEQATLSVEALVGTSATPEDEVMMSITISRLGLATVLAITSALACGSGETTQGFADPVQGGYQSPPVGEENGSQPPNNLMACTAETGCQSCETPCHLCQCRFDGGQIDDNEYALCIAAPDCVAALREYAGAQVGLNNGPDAQFLQGGDQQQGCARFADDACTYCECVGGTAADCAAACGDTPNP